MSLPTLKALVHTMRYEAEGIISVELRPASGDVTFPAFEAGSHIDLHLPNGLVRNYSLLNSTADSQRYVVGVLNDRRSRGGSRYIHEKLRVGTILPISAPRNNFSLHPGKHSVLLAGGIGVTPMLSMLRALVVQGRSVDFIYCARSRKEAAFIADINEFSSVAGVQVSWHFNDEQGGLPDIKRLLAGYAADTPLYSCGPAPMLAAFELACAELGYANIHLERFAAAPAEPLQAAASAEGYCVQLQRTGITITVPPGMFLLDALLAAGIEHDHSCKEGLCGACETKVLAGEVDHQDSILTKSERAANKTMMVCVSGCKQGPLVLDI